MNENNTSDFTLEDIYFKDAFTQTGDKLNLEINDITLDSFISSNNKFSLDNDGNLVVKSLTTTNGLSNVSEIVNLIYPVGSIYLSVNNTNPSTLFGGTWELITNKFLIGAGGSYSLGSTGGTTSVTSGKATGNTGSTTLTIEQIPSHQHNVQGYNTSGSTVTWSDRAVEYGGSSVGYGSGIRTNYTGGGSGHTHTLNEHIHDVSIIPPYLAVNIWKRTE